MLTQFETELMSVITNATAIVQTLAIAGLGIFSFLWGVRKFREAVYAGSSDPRSVAHGVYTDMWYDHRCDESSDEYFSRIEDSKKYDEYMKEQMDFYDNN